MKRSKKGVLIIILGVICLFISLLINRFVDIDDIICIILMILSLIIEIFGLFEIIKDTYN